MRTLPIPPCAKYLISPSSNAMVFVKYFVSSKNIPAFPKYLYLVLNTSGLFNISFYGLSTILYLNNILLSIGISNIGTNLTNIAECMWFGCREANIGVRPKFAQTLPNFFGFFAVHH